MRSEQHLIRQLQQIIHLLHLLPQMVEMVDFSISNLDSSSSKVGEDMALEIIILHNHQYPVLIPPETLHILYWDLYWHWYMAMIPYWLQIVATIACFDVATRAQCSQCANRDPLGFC